MFSIVSWVGRADSGRSYTPVVRMLWPSRNRGARGCGANVIVSLLTGSWVMVRHPLMRILLPLPRRAAWHYPGRIGHSAISVECRASIKGAPDIVCTPMALRMRPLRARSQTGGLVAVQHRQAHGRAALVA